MRLLGRYLVEIILSSINPLFFRSAVRRSAFSAFGYYVFFTLLHGIAVSGAGLYWFNRHFSPMLDQATLRLPNFTVHLAHGELSTSLPQPLAFGDRDFMLIIDTTGEDHDLGGYKSALLVSKTKAVAKKSAFERREFYFEPLPDFTVTLKQVVNWLKSYQGKIGLWLFSLAAFVLFPLVWTFVVPVALACAVLFFILAKIIRAPLKMGQAVTIAFYAFTLPTLAQTAMIAAGLPLKNWYWWLYLAWGALGVTFCRIIPPENSESITVPPPPAHPA